MLIMARLAGVACCWYSFFFRFSIRSKLTWFHIDLLLKCILRNKRRMTKEKKRTTKTVKRPMSMCYYQPKSEYSKCFSNTKWKTKKNCLATSNKARGLDSVPMSKNEIFGFIFQFNWSILFCLWVQSIHFWFRTSTVFHHNEAQLDCAT